MKYQVLGNETLKTAILYKDGDPVGTVRIVPGTDIVLVLQDNGEYQYYIPDESDMHVYHNMTRLSEVPASMVNWTPEAKELGVV